MSDFQRVGMTLIFVVMFIAATIRSDAAKALLWALVLAVLCGVIINLARQM